ncbi:UDP-N-acetylmuramoyl-tripeptide--D-alanyl-D-alanine ligase [Corynebacterium faecale]|uniref:UDP-N-acetylmuramoyl-tripeptide--D-alanyl-D- alanine ligase n=1 Tax=Corynebacterium faecale TaxID=1758466 RepID=UPI0025B3890F|nr:UDP-N-acetylmuramoyl-tripeptide--D-alanyl-D-alanine ligase [Corynebacterium faecale]WJY92687.1 UDP-N-acetylmuramoyl-tripeptide--D-alanyl-D-alanine ligase [Corynebacterium faecale]
MIQLTLGEIATIVGGELAGGASADTPVTGTVEFDSRKITPGGLFLALPGAQVDGHEFAATAVGNGAVAVLAAREVDAPSVLVPPVGRSDSNADIYAHDPDGHGAAVIEALSRLARHVVDTSVSDHSLAVVALTGSAGKTSTKDFIATVLSMAGDTVAPPGSFNNEVGLPYTALRCTEGTRYLVSEMSARGIGHIAHLARITPPRIGAVLNVGSAHLGEFGSRANIAQAKGELIEALPAAAEGGVAVLNADDPFVANMAPRTRARVVTFSTATPPAKGADYWATDLILDDVARASFTLHTRNGSWPVALQVFGEHQVSNALAAAAVTIEAGVDESTVVSGLSSHAAASAHRMDVRTRADGVTIINDAYNANPDSMRAGIAALAYTASARHDSQSWAVLGQMGELGDEATEEHRALGAELAKYHIERLITVGDNPNCRALGEEAAALGVTTSAVPDTDSAVELLRHQVRKGDVVLVKASNADQLWRVAEDLHAKFDGEPRRNVEGI